MVTNNIDKFRNTVSFKKGEFVFVWVERESIVGKEFFCVSPRGEYVIRGSRELWYAGKKLGNYVKPQEQAKRHYKKGI